MSPPRLAVRHRFLFPVSSGDAMRRYRTFVESRYVELKISGRFTPKSVILPDHGFRRSDTRTIENFASRQSGHAVGRAGGHMSSEMIGVVGAGLMGAEIALVHAL